MTPGLLLNADELRILFRMTLQGSGERAAFCRAFKINQSHLANFLGGIRPPGPKLLAAFGLQEKTFFVVAGRAPAFGAGWRKKPGIWKQPGWPSGKKRK